MFSAIGSATLIPSPTCRPHSREGTLSASIAIRFFSLSPEGELLRLSQVFVQWLHHHPEKVRVQSFAGRTMRFVECLLVMEEGRAVGIRQMSFSLIRFDEEGRPDMKRYWKEAYAAMPCLLGSKPGEIAQEGNVLCMEQVFVGNGGKWSPTIEERMLLEKAAMGKIKPKELDRGWRASRLGVPG